MQSPFGESPFILSREQALRIKVTDKCPWRCSFCHSEGSRDNADMSWGPELQQVILALKKALPKIKEIHYTGGEPTKNPELATITAGLVAMGLEVKTTTNGQFNAEELERLSEAGLESYNFSVHSVEAEDFLATQEGRGVSRTSGKKRLPSLTWAHNQVQQELASILRAKELGAEVKINTVISTIADMPRVKKVIDWSRSHHIPLRLLNDLGNGMESILAIRDILKSLGAEEILRKANVGSSSCSTVYRLPDGYEIAFKQMRDLKLASMCRGCPRDQDGSCEEQFYGIRLEQRADKQYQVRLCLQEENDKTTMSVENFLVSDALKEIQSLIND
ncbi:MAG: radical SAM protein [Patescibacteria group bacterium]|nr:radical SAM protein [Patescibacteria group bacterium]